MGGIYIVFALQSFIQSLNDIEYDSLVWME